MINLTKHLILIFVLSFFVTTAFSQNSTENGREAGNSPNTEVPKKEKKLQVPKTFKSDYDTPNKDNVVADDQIVQGSLAVGLDAVNAEVFGFNTIILKENNLRIKFDDTSNDGEEYPTNDWILEANSSDLGGADYFAIQDATANVNSFQISAGAPLHSLFIKNDGKVGFKNSDPSQDIHLLDGNTPTFRLEQDNSSGWSPQTWDVSGNESNFFIRDATNGNTLPFRIIPGAPTSSLYINSDGNIGLGSSSPNEKLFVDGSIKFSNTLKFTPLADAPASAEEGYVFSHDDSNDLKYFNGSKWLSLTNPGAKIVNDSLIVAADSVSLANYLNSDDQNLSSATFSGTVLEIGIENGSSVSVDLSAISNTDEQDLVAATLTGNILDIEIENGASVSVDLYPLIENLETRIAALEGQTNVNNMEYAGARVFQNTPNPFISETKIPFFIPEEVQDARLAIFDIKGIKLSETPVNERGNGSFTVSKSLVSSGTFFYTLILDGRKISSKIMVKTD